jgi:hypothetical protein
MLHMLNIFELTSLFMVKQLFDAHVLVLHVFMVKHSRLTLFQAHVLRIFTWFKHPRLIFLSSTSYICISCLWVNVLHFKHLCVQVISSYGIRHSHSRLHLASTHASSFIFSLHVNGSWVNGLISCNVPFM